MSGTRTLLRGILACMPCGAHKIAVLATDRSFSGVVYFHCSIEGEGRMSAYTLQPHMRTVPALDNR